MTQRQLLRAPERQASIVRGAATAFARAGFSRTSMEDIAEASGITKLIVYRHFGSKEELYRRVLDEVHLQMRDLFLEGRPDGLPVAVAVRAFVAAARDNPDGFRLLWRHAAREPDFAGYAEEVRERAVGVARELLAPFVTDDVLAAWGAHTLVAYLVEATLNWLDHGDAARDDEFEDLAVRSLVALGRSWMER